MASNPQTMAKLLKNLRDNGKVMLQCGALTYIRSNAQKLETATTLTKEERTEICKLVMNMATSANQDIRSEGIKALYSILKFFKSDELKFFESAMQIKRSCRTELFKFLEGADDSSIVAAANDPATTIFLEDCLRSIKTATMPWLLPSSSDNVQMLREVENASITESDELEMIIVNKALALLQRFYKMVMNNSANIESIHKFEPLVIDKIMKLAYLGHKKQREPAINMLNQAIDTDLASRLKTKYPDVWLRYKNDLQGSYTGRMTLLVKACEHNWSNLWCISIKLLGTELHRGATMINNLLSVEEKAFKSTDTVVRRDAFVSWKLLIDNFALDIRELATPRRVKLLCVPLTAKNSKSELIALTKLEVWWYLIVKIYENIGKFADPVLTQFLNFCFGPLGDTPLLSSTFDVIASPGKKFYKTKLIAIDALLQMLVFQQNDRIFFTPILQDKLPRSISEMLFKDFHKTFLHSVGEAIILVSQLQASELRHREEICKVLWTNLMHYVRTTSNESKSIVYKELLLLVKELLIRAADVSFVNSFIREVIVAELAAIASELIYHDSTLVDLMTKLMVPSILKNLQPKQCDAMKSLMWQTVRPLAQSNVYHPETLKFLGFTLNNLRCVPLDDNAQTDCFELWCVYADIAHKYMKALQCINEGTDGQPHFKTIESIIIFPLTHMAWANSLQAQRIAAHWKNVYKKFEGQTDSVLKMKNNQVLEVTSLMIADCLQKNEKCYRIAVYCLDALLSTINYKFLLAQNTIPTIVRLVGELTTIALHEGSPAEAECSLKAFSSLLITVFGHSSEKSLFYMQATSKTVEMMLKMDAEDGLLKEITSTWETIVSILRGLCNQLDSGFLLSYKQIILLSLKHANPEISFQTRKVLEMKENMKESARLVLVEFAQESGIQLTKKDTPKTKTDKNDKTPKQTRITGSFLNRKIPSPKPTSAKSRDKDERKIGPLPPEPDSQDYVLIKSDVKIDVNRLTEHQKESFKRRRDDIPALYNDLSQSSSQDTQDLQKWFGGKKNDAKVSSDIEKSCNIAETTRLDDKIEEIVSTSEENIINEPIVTNETRENVVESSIPETMPSSAQDPNLESMSSELTCEKSMTEDNDKGQMENTKNPLDNMTPASDDSYVAGTKSPQIESPSNETTDVSKKLNFESRDEYPEANKNMEEDKSPSLITSSGKTNRGLRSGKNVGASQMDEKTPKNVGRIRAKSTVTEGERRSSEMSEETNEILAKSKDKAKSSTMTRSQTSVSVERGTKRKAVSDSENEANERETRRRKMSRSRSRTPENSENSTLSSKQRRRECEMSRLRIDMVFEPIPSKRRSKYSEDFVSTDNIGKRQPSPKSTRAKTAKSENSVTNSSLTNSKPRRSSRGVEKDVVADPAKKRKKNTKEVDNAEVENQTTKTVGKSGRSKKNLQEIGSASESQIIVDDEENPENSTMNVDSEKSMNIAINETQTQVELTENVSSPKISEPPLVIITELPLLETSELATVVTDDVTMENDLDEVVESSQDSTVFTGNHKRSFAKIVKSKISNDPPRNYTLEISMEKKQPRASSPICPESVAIADNEVAIDKNILEDADETFLDISAIRPQLADDVPCEDTEKKVPEASKTSASPVPIRANEVNFNFSSPKGSSKRFVKARSFAPQGRAAHMLGLVTKLATMEKDIEKIPIEDDAAVTTKKTKNREIEDKRSSITKETERIGSPGGSRQEKIFNNMKAADYAASPPGKLFGNLRNDGEKISPKMEKFHLNDNDNDSSRTKDDDNVSGISEKDELPILEWSSANPPSLTASPSASILKRNRSIVNETDIDQSTKITRKRVSFADPPVSKEMGYQIEVPSPHKVNKFVTSRGLLGRRDSPIRIKQSRFKMIQIDPEKTERDEEPRIPNSISDVDSECARDNELLMKIAEDLEETVDLQTPENIVNNEGFGVSITNEITDEFAINDVETNKQIEDDIATQEPEEKIEEIGPIAKDINLAEEAPTQDDLFNSSDEKVDSPKIDRSIVISEKLNNSGQSSAMDSFKLNVTDDSVIGNITDSYGEDAEKSESLEDTIDIRNVTNLNMTTNSEEGLDERPQPTSNQGGDTVSQMDTLTITDSILASLPISQDSQGPSQAQVEIPRPELLNSTEPIYPTLMECQKPIDDLIPDLADQLWRRNLAKNMETRGIRTIGDLARLSEREIARIPVKGRSKIDFVRKVLAKYEKTLSVTEDKVTDNKDEGAERLEDFPPMESATNATEDLELPQEIQKSLGDISLLASNLKFNSNSAILDHSTPATRIPDCSVSDDDFDPHARHALGRTSTGISGLTINLDPTTVLEDTSNMSQISTINLSADTIPLTTNSVGTCTDPPLKISTNSVGLQTIDEDLLDEIEGCPKGTARRLRAEKLLKDYKVQMQSTSDLELTEDTMRLLEIDTETMLKVACRECGLDKVLRNLPDIFETEQQFYPKLLSAYRNKIKISDCMELHEHEDIKKEICKKCSSAELLEMLTRTLKDEEERDVKTPINEATSLSGILRRLPINLISETIGNNELVPSSVVLDVGLQKNDADIVTKKLETEYPEIMKNIFDRRIATLSREEILSVNQAIAAKLSPQDLLDSFNTAMKMKLNKNS